MSTDFSVNSECVKTFQMLATEKKYSSIIFTINADISEIIVNKTSENRNYDDFLDDLPENECGWVVYDFKYEVDGLEKNKVLFISWSPESARAKTKMLYTAQKTTLRRSLPGVDFEIMATEREDLDYASVLAKAERH